MEKEKVLEIEITKINKEWSVWYIKYQNEEVFKRGEFIDNELNTYSKTRPYYNCEENRLYLRGIVSKWDLEITPIKNKDVEKLKEKVRLINNKYGIKKRWRAKEKGSYWYIDESLELKLYREDLHSYDDNLHKIGNYFQTKEEAQLYADKIKKLLSERE